LPVPLSPANEHGSAGGSHLENEVVDFFHLGGRAHERAELAELSQLVPELADLVFLVEGSCDVLDDRVQALDLDRLLQVVRSPLLHRLPDAVEAGVRRDHDRLRGGSRLELLEEVEARAIGQQNIEEDRVDAGRAQDVARLADRGRSADVEACLGEDPRDELERNLVVI
jgi:hypothetical protein